MAAEPRPRAICPRCRRSVALRKDGTFRVHGFVQGLTDTNCLGPERPGATQAR